MRLPKRLILKPPTDGTPIRVLPPAKSFVPKHTLKELRRDPDTIANVKELIESHANKITNPVQYLSFMKELVAESTARLEAAQDAAKKYGWK